jgi:hypothetical protein
MCLNFWSSTARNVIIIVGLHMDLFFVNIVVKKPLLDEEYNETFRSEILKWKLFYKTLVMDFWWSKLIF